MHIWIQFSNFPTFPLLSSIAFLEDFEESLYAVLYHYQKTAHLLPTTTILSCNIHSHFIRERQILNKQILIDDGCVSLETMLKFLRLAQMRKNPQVIMRALKKSTPGLVEVSGSTFNIRRMSVLFYCQVSFPMPLNAIRREYENLLWRLCKTYA